MTADDDETNAARTARELDDDRRIARLRQALNAGIERVCEADPGMTYGDVVDALTGVSHRYAQHFRRTDTIPIALPADVEMLCLAPGVGPDGLYDTERAFARPPAALPASGVQISAVVLPNLATAGVAALAVAAEALARDARGDLVLVAADVPAGLFDVGEETIVSGDAADQNAYGFVVAVRPAAAQLVDEPERPPQPDAAPAFTTVVRQGGLCGRCGSPDHRQPACDADDFTAAAWLGRN